MQAITFWQSWNVTYALQVGVMPGLRAPKAVCDSHADELNPVRKLPYALERSISTGEERIANTRRQPHLRGQSNPGTYASREQPLSGKETP
jgi:hypothetical protein